MFYLFCIYTCIKVVKTGLNNRFPMIKFQKPAIELLKPVSPIILHTKQCQSVVIKYNYRCLYMCKCKSILNFDKLKLKS